jgi:hypothetical protein
MNCRPKVIIILFKSSILFHVSATTYHNTSRDWATMNVTSGASGAIDGSLLLAAVTQLCSCIFPFIPVPLYIGSCKIRLSGRCSLHEGSWWHHTGFDTTWCNLTQVTDDMKDDDTAKQSSHFYSIHTYASSSSWLSRHHAVTMPSLCQYLTRLFGRYLLPKWALWRGC